MKKIIAAVLFAAFVAGVAIASMDEKATVEKVEGDKVTVTYKKVEVKVGDKVEVKADVKDAVAAQCTVEAVEGENVTMTCEKTALKVGEKVEVTAAAKEADKEEKKEEKKEGKKVEGC